MAAAGKEAQTALSGAGGAKPFEAISAGAADAATKTKDALGQAQELADQQKAAAAAAAKIAADAKKQAADQKVLSDAALKSQKEAANQARMLGPQLTDIFVGLSTGQSPFTVLLQQGGQLKDVFGGVGNAAKALLSVFTPVRVVLGAVAAAIGTVAYEAIQGAQESAALNKTLALTGNIAGTSAGQLGTMAKEIAASQQAAVGDVRQTLTALVGTGEFTQTTLASAGKAATALSKLTGQSAEDTIKSFDGMSNGVAAWAQKSNQAYNYLTVEQYKYIQSLESQGRTQEAMKVALDALSSTMEQRSAPAVGVLEKAWTGLKNVLSGVLQNLRDIGKESTPESRLDSLKTKLAALQAQAAVGGEVSHFGVPVEKVDTSAEQARLKAAIELGEAEVAANKRAAGKIAGEKVQTDLDILHESKSFQDSLAAVDEAGTQKRLGEQLAALDKRQAALDLANAKDLLSIRDYNQQLNTIDQQRLQAQAAAVQRQIQIASGRAGNGTEQDRLASQAQVTALQGQLAQIRGQISAAGTKARLIAETDAYAEATETTAAWTQIWKQAFDQVRSLAQQNAASNAAQIADPIERARAEAALKVADIERQVGELKAQLTLRLNLTIDPARAAELQSEIDRLAEQAKTSIDETTRTATFQSLQQQFADLTQAITLQEQRLDIAVEQSALTTVEAEKRKFAARAAALPQLEAIQQAQAALATTVGEKNAIEQQSQAVLKLKDTTTEFQRSLKDAGVNSFVTEIGNISSGAKTAKQGLLDMVGSFAKSWGDLLNRRLGEQFYDQLSSAASKFAAENSGGWLGTLLGFFGIGGGSSAAASTSSSGGLSSAGSGFGAQYGHTGAVIGGAGGWRAQVPAAAFYGAPRFHTGGILGLKPNEVPFVGEMGEEVLTKDDPRHVRNGGTSGVGDVNISVQVSGAEGTATDQRGAVDKLTAQVKAIVVAWAADESRQGGILAKGR